MRTIYEHEFAQLKEFFDKNDTYSGAQYLTQMFEQFLENCMTENYQGDPQHAAPFDVGPGLCLTQEYYGEGYKPVLSLESEDAIGLDPELIKGLEKMAQEIVNLKSKVGRLEAMHDDDSDLAHIPRIISTKEQYEAMKDEVDAEERVLVTTTFDKAMSVL